MSIKQLSALFVYKNTAASEFVQSIHLNHGQIVTYM